MLNGLNSFISVTTVIRIEMREKRDTVDVATARRLRDHRTDFVYHKLLLPVPLSFRLPIFTSIPFFEQTRINKQH